MAMTEGVQKAFLATIIPQEFKATGFGLYNTLVGLAVFPASLIGRLTLGSFWPPGDLPLRYGHGLAGSPVISLRVIEDKAASGTRAYPLIFRIRADEPDSRKRSAIARIWPGRVSRSNAAGALGNPSRALKKRSKGLTG